MSFECLPFELQHKICSDHLAFTFQHPLVRHPFDPYHHETLYEDSVSDEIVFHDMAMRSVLGCKSPCRNHDLECSWVVRDMKQLLRAILVLTRINRTLRAVTHDVVTQYRRRVYESYTRATDRRKLHFERWLDLLGKLRDAPGGSRILDARNRIFELRLAGRAQCDSTHLLADHIFVLAELQNLATKIWGKDMTQKWDSARLLSNDIADTQEATEDEVFFMYRELIISRH